MLATEALANIRIVLIQTFHPGNIGSAARAMKTMGLTNLVLVNPREFPHEDATAMAAGATDVLDQARVVGSLQEAIVDCALVIGTSARDRTFSLPPLLPEACAEKLVQESNQGPVALIFGRERMGLHNDEIQQCHFQVNIPANPEYPVLNIASAIQILCYEMYRSLDRQDATHVDGVGDDYPLVDDLNQFYTHLESTLNHVGFLKPQHQGQTMPRFQRLFRRARLEKKELQLLRGMLSRIEKMQPDASDSSNH
jgi:tRNA (cytidine32/uridine32-2'-O)-methyltransferase